MCNNQYLENQGNEIKSKTNIFFRTTEVLLWRASVQD